MQIAFRMFQFRQNALLVRLQQHFNNHLIVNVVQYKERNVMLLTVVNSVTLIKL